MYECNAKRYRRVYYFLVLMCVFLTNNGKGAYIMSCVNKLGETYRKLRGISEEANIQNKMS